MNKDCKKFCGKIFGKLSSFVIRFNVPCFQTPINGYTWSYTWKDACLMLDTVPTAENLSLTVQETICCVRNTLHVQYTVKIQVLLQHPIKIEICVGCYYSTEAV